MSPAASEAASAALRARMERPVLCTVVCRFDAPAEGRAAAGRFDVADSYAPCWWDARSDPRQGTLPGPGGRRLDPLQGKTPRARLRQGPRGADPDRGSRSHDRVG